MVDIYNEIGLNYNPSNEIKKNLFDVYLKIYFPKITTKDFDNIIQYVNGTGMIENEYLHNTVMALQNDLIMENEIINLVTDTDREEEYKKYFKKKIYYSIGYPYKFTFRNREIRSLQNF